jgi:hypothetical protein
MIFYIINHLDTLIHIQLSIQTSTNFHMDSLTDKWNFPEIVQSFGILALFIQ